MSRSPYLSLEMRIAADERGGIVHRWRYGRRLLAAKTGRKQLPDGLLDSLVTAAEAAGLRLSRQEVQRRVRCAEVYATDQEVRQAADALGSWSALVNAGFPTVEPDEPDLEPDDLEAAAPDAWGQPTLIPGFGETIKVHGRRIPLDEATVGDAKDYRETYRQIHENFGKTLALIESAVDAMVDGSDGDDDANAVESWRRGTDDETSERAS
jgi:hypothetical protein